ncbi:MAG: hypothetical protein LBB82_01710 [Treponema sp.]|nr:hypothetical protein [Treponema sp.]
MTVRDVLKLLHNDGWFLGSLQGINTSKSRVLRLQILQNQMREIYEASSPSSCGHGVK